MAYDGSLKFDTKIDSKGFQKGITGLKSIASSSVKMIGGLMAGAAVAVAGIGIASVKVGSQFTSSMSNVAATMGITVDEINNGSESFEMLKKAAKDMGKSTQFSASQSAEALNYLALAGYDAEKAVEALPKVLNLAAAGGLDLAYTSDLVTDSMSALGLEMSELEGFTDQLAKTSQKSNTNVGQLGEAILTVGGTAKILKGGTVELNTQLGILADNGIKGSEGGTALRNVLLSLSAPTDKQAAAMKSLGIETYDASGKLKSTDEIFQELNGTLGEMTDKERTEVLAKLFNKVDLKAANALLAGSGERFGELSKEIANSEGAAAAMAETLNDNLTGKVTILKSALEGLGIEIFEGMDAPLQAVVETITGYVDKLSGVMTAHDDIKASAEELGMTAEELGFNLSEIPNGLEGAATVVGEILGDIIVRVAEFAPKMLEMAVSLITAVIDGIRENGIRIAEAAVELVTGFATAFLEILPQIISLGFELITMLIQGIAESMPQLIPLAAEAITTITNSIVTNLPLILDAGLQILLSLIEGIGEAFPVLMEAAFNILTTLVGFIVENLPALILVGLDLLMALVKGILDNLPILIKVVPPLITTIVEELVKKLPEILEIGIKIVIALVEGIISNINQLVTTTIELIDIIFNALIENLPEIVKAGLELVEVLAQALIDNTDLLVDSAFRLIDGLVNFILDNIDLLINVALELVMAIVEGLLNNIDLLVNAAVSLVLGIIEGLLNMLPDLIAAGLKLVFTIIEGLLSAIPDLIGAGSKLIGRLLSAIVQMLPQLLLMGVELVLKIVAGLIQTSDRLLTAGGQLIESAIKSMLAIAKGALSIGKDLVEGIWTGITNAKDWLLRKISDFADSITTGIKKFFKIESPSKLFRDEVGVMLGKGLAIGIDKSKKDVDNSANRMAKSVLDIAKKMNSDNKAEVTKYNTEIKQLEKRAKEDIHSIQAKASNNKRKLTQDEVIRIQRIKEDSIKKVKALEEKASKESIKIAQQNSKLMLEMSDEYVKEKQRKGEMSLKDEVHFWNQLSLIVNSKSEEYKVALENRQKAISQINAEVIKINEDHTKQMLDIDKKLVEETEKLNDQYAKAYESRVSDLVGVGGLFNEFVENDMIAGDKLISNLESQVVALGQYEGIIGILGERIGNADLVSELEQLGPKSIGELKSLASLTDEQLAEYVNLYEVKFKMAARQAEKELAPMKENTERQIEVLNKASQEKLSILQVEWTKSIQNLVTGTEKELDTLNLVGVNAIKGLEDGMLSMEGSLMETAQRIASNIASTIKSALDIHSPSRLMRDQVGKNITRGIGVGLKDGMTDLERDVKTEMSRLTKQMKATVDIETKSSARVITGSSGYSRGNEVITNNNDNGVVQNVTIVNPQRTPSENARELKKVGRDLALGY